MRKKKGEAERIDGEDQKKGEGENIISIASSN